MKFLEFRTSEIASAGFSGNLIYIVSIQEGLSIPHQQHVVS